MMNILSFTVLASILLSVHGAEKSYLTCFNDTSLSQCNASCMCSSTVQNIANNTQNSNENVGLAFALVTGAGLSTTFGASLGNS